MKKIHSLAEYFALKNQNRVILITDSLRYNASRKLHYNSDDNRTLTTMPIQSRMRAQKRTNISIKTESLLRNETRAIWNIATNIRTNHCNLAGMDTSAHY